MDQNLTRETRGTTAEDKADLRMPRPPLPGDDALAQLDADLRDQSAATHQGDIARAAALAERSVAALAALRQEGSPPAGLLRALTRARDLALYNQLLLRYAFTAWAAQRLERRRRALAYDERGRPTTALSGEAAQAALHVSHQGVL